MKRKKIYIKDIITTLDGTDYIIIDDGGEKLKGITKDNFASQIGVTIENKIVATEDNIADFATNSGSYTFDERDMIQLAPDGDGNVLVYIFLGGTKTDVNSYVKVDYSKIDWANVLNKADATDTVKGIVELATEAEVLTGTDNTKAITPATKNGGVKIYKALISQSGTSAPTAIILENTLGEVPVLSRTGVGDYDITVSGSIFASNKTFISCANIDATTQIGAFRGSDTNIKMYFDEDIPIVDAGILIEVYP